MQSRTLKPRKNYPKHAELASSTPDPNSSIAHMLEMVGERKKVLDVGCASGYLSSLMVKRECDVVGVDINPIAAEEARKYCTSVIVADLDEVVLPELLEGRQFEAIVFGDVLEHLHEPARTLDESRGLLGERGYVVASIPNVSHGAIRLALLSGRFDYQELGILDDAHLRFFTAKTIDELFLTAGYRIDVIQRVTLPIFAESELVPALDPRDFDEVTVADVRSDPESETLQFVVKAFPLSNDQRLRAVSKRFLAANTELTATKQQIAHRENELQALRSTMESQDAVILDLREEANRASNDLDSTKSELKRLDDAYRTLEVDSLAKQNAAMERILAVQTERSQLEMQNGSLDLHAAESLEQLERELRMLRAHLEAEQNRAEELRREFGEAVATRDDARRRLENESRRAAIRELRLADAVASQNEARLQLENERAEAANLQRSLAEAELLRASVQTLKGDIASLARDNAQLEERFREELGEKGQLESALQAERARAAELQQLTDSLQVSADALRIEVTALTQGKLQIEGLLHGEIDNKARLEDALRAEHGRAGELQMHVRTLQSSVKSLESEVAAGFVALERSEALLQHTERLYSNKIARTESDCAELLADATETIDAARAQLETERSSAEARHRSDTTSVSELEEQLEAIRKAAMADKLVMRAYANEFQQRAEKAETEFEKAIRQRDDLYLRVLETERTVRDSSEQSGRLQAEISSLEEIVHRERSHAQSLEAELRGLEVAVREEQSRTQSAEAIVRELRSRVRSLENDVAHQQAALQHLRESAERDSVRADSAAGELASLTVRYEILQANLAEMENRLAAQTEELLVSTSAESARLATLIDTAQSSHFWKLKNWLVRLRVRALGSALPPERVRVKSRP